MDPDYGAALLAVLFTRAPVGLHVLDRELRVVHVNTRPLAEQGVAPADVIGRTWQELGLATDEVLRMMHGVLETGDEVIDHVYQAPQPLGSPTGRTLSVSLFRLSAPDGQPLGIAATLLDITERERTRSRLEILRRAGDQIGSTLEVDRTAQELVGVMVGGLADLATVDVLDSVLHGEAPAPGPMQERVTLRRVAFAVAPGKAMSPAFEPGSVRVLRHGTPQAQTLGDLEPRRAGLTTEEDWLAEDRHHAQKVRESDMHALLVLPLTARGVVLGLVSLYRAVDAPPFDDDDVTLAADLADRAALSIDNARRYTREHALARLIQRRLVPAQLPEHAAVETAYSYLPVASSGVWYDVIALSGCRVALVAGDVSGQGMPAVTTMGRLRTVLGALATMDLPVVELLERLHELTGQLAREYPSGAESPTELTATCLFIVYDPTTCACELASAGHPMPVALMPDGRAEILEVPRGPVLGRGVPHYTVTRVTVPPGTVLALRSASLVKTDATSELRLYRETLNRPAVRLWDACDALLSALIPQDPVDDAMLLLARTRVLGPERVAAWTLPGAPESAAEARRLVRTVLGEWGMEEQSSGAELIASELVTNAVRYSSGPVELRLIRDSTLICEVSDPSGATPQLRHAETEDEGGRGLYLVAQLSRRWGMRPLARGKTIWAEPQPPE
jgi:PAS domain S-box-containing protein